MASDLEDAEELFHQGNRCLKARDLTGAEAHFRRAVQLAPELMEAHVNLGLVLERKGNLAEAEIAYATALALDDHCEQVYVNLGALLLRQKRLEEAEAICRSALGPFPESAGLWANLGAVSLCQKREAEAEQCLRKALAIDPERHTARFNLGYLLLRHGHFEEGWPAQESRARNLELMASIPDTHWQGQSLVGKSLIIAIEGGMGDLIHFGRYASILKERGAARIGIVCHPPLKRLFTTLTGVDQVLVLDEPVSDADWDYWVLPMSLPFLCGTRWDSIPATIPYLRPFPENRAAWQSRLPATSFRVGLAWRGNPLCENDADRSLPHLDTLGPLAAVEGVSFISLQKGPGEDQAQHPPEGMPLFDAGPWIEDFADTAALVAELDLVITVDTSVAHLAGALGKPCWVMLPDYKTDLRWLVDREDSPWYPTMKLFRQTADGQWPPVIERIREELKRFVLPGS